MGKSRKALIFPQPKRVRWGEGEVKIVHQARLRFQVVVPQQLTTYEALALEEVLDALNGPTPAEADIVRPSVASPEKNKIYLGAMFVQNKLKRTCARLNEALREEAYLIDVKEKEIWLGGASPLGTLQAARTFKQILRQAGRSFFIPRVRITDWPDFPHRGMFIEAYSGSDLMRLADWKDMLDFFASLKFNTVSIGLYSCWRRLDHNKEYLFVPLKVLSRVKTWQEKSFHSPTLKRKMTRRYLPLIYKEDLFGEIISYSKEKGIEIIPYFSSLGHNTVIPRLYPEVSMKDAKGKPKNYGFCMSSPATYRLLFAVYDEIIKRYMEPHGLDKFHIGLDEVRDFCECRRCRRLSPEEQGELFTDFIVRLVGHLVKRGAAKVIMWYDMLYRTGLLNERFVDKLRKKGLLGKIAIHWWSYDEPPRNLEVIHPWRYSEFPHLLGELGIEAWVAPTTGLDPYNPLALRMPWWLSHIFSLTQLGKGEGAQGAMTYSRHEVRFHQGYFAFADAAWNRQVTLTRFQRRYGDFLFGEGSVQGQRALRLYNDALAPFKTVFSAMGTRFVVEANIGEAIVNQPAEVLSEKHFAKSQEMLLEAERTLSKFRDNEKREREREFLAALVWDVDYVRAILTLVYKVLEAGRIYKEIQANPAGARRAAQRLLKAINAVNDSLALFDGVMADAEELRARFHLPEILRRATVVRKYFLRLISLLTGVQQKIERGEVRYLPLLNLKGPTFRGDEIGIAPF